MKLFQTYASPFPTRVRLLLYAKRIDVEIIEPPGFHASTEAKGEYLKVNPIGRVPTCAGRRRAGSEVICESGGRLSGGLRPPILGPGEDAALKPDRDFTW